MMMENEQLERTFGDMTDTVVALQRHIDHVRQIFSASSSGLPSSPAPTSPHLRRDRSTSRLERRIEELESNKRDLTNTLYTVQDEARHAVRAREDIMKRYRLLIRFSARLLQRMIEDFPDEEYDDELCSTVKKDLKRSMFSSSSGSSRSTTTARPESRVTNRSSVASLDHPLSIITSQSGPPLLLHRDHTPEDGSLERCFIHCGSRLPVGVKYAAGPLPEASFIQLGIEKNELDELFTGLIHPNDVTIRLATLPSPQGLETLKLVFLYDPFYLESGTRSYILDWATSRTKRKIVEFLKDNADRNASPVFQTFTYSKSKKQWYYFGSLRWAIRHHQSVWPTLDDEVKILQQGFAYSDNNVDYQSRSLVLKKLSDRSHGSVMTGEVEKQMSDGRLTELTIEIASVGSMEVMRDIAIKLGQRLKEAKVRTPRSKYG